MKILHANNGEWNKKEIELTRGFQINGQDARISGIFCSVCLFKKHMFAQIGFICFGSVSAHCADMGYFMRIWTERKKREVNLDIRFGVWRTPI